MVKWTPGFMHVALRFISISSPRFSLSINTIFHFSISSSTKSRVHTTTMAKMIKPLAFFLLLSILLVSVSAFAYNTNHHDPGHQEQDPQKQYRYVVNLSPILSLSLLRLEPKCYDLFCFVFVQFDVF